MRNSIKYKDSLETGTGQFYYYDCHIGEVYSPMQYCCGVWHYVAVTIAEDGTSVLYVDNVEDGHDMDNTRDTIKWSMTPFSTFSRPDNGLDGDTAVTGTFTVGMGPYGAEPFIGYMEEIRVWNRALETDEVEEVIYARTVPQSSYDELKAYYQVKAGEQGQESVIVDNSGSGNSLTPVEIAFVPIPPMIPCTLGIEQIIGPCDGACAMKVYGWSFADSTMLTAKFGNEQVHADFIGPTEIGVVSPGHFSPREVGVVAANDAKNFTDFYYIQKETTHIFMESSLYVNGLDGAGASADSVCSDLPGREVSFGGWFCPKCGPLISPPSPSPSPPPPPSPINQPLPPPPPPVNDEFGDRK